MKCQGQSLIFPGHRKTGPDLPTSVPILPHLCSDGFLCKLQKSETKAGQGGYGTRQGQGWGEQIGHDPLESCCKKEDRKGDDTQDLVRLSLLSKGGFFSNISEVLSRSVGVGGRPEASHRVFVGLPTA